MKNKDLKEIIPKNKKAALKIILVGILAGALSGLFASGGGLLLVPVFVYIFKTTEKEARAMSIFCILPMVLASLFFYNKSQYIDFKLGIFCGIGGMIGGIIGAKLLNKVKDKYLILMFIAFLIYAAISILRM